MTRPTIFWNVALLFGVIACDKQVLSPSTTASTVVATRPQGWLTYDEQLLGIADGEPGFAGVFAADGGITILLTDVQRAPGARQAAMRILGDSRIASATARPAVYSFRELYAWKATAKAGLRMIGVNSFDIDESQNAIRVGVLNQAIGDRVRTTLFDLGIPATAVLVEIERPATVVCTNLQARCRGTSGGLQIYWNSTQWCTLGFNATYYPGGVATSVYATNGHCTQSWGSVSAGTPHYQNRWAVGIDSIGAESWESSIFGPSQDYRCGDLSFSCKYSDISIGRYGVSTQVLGYFLERPTQRSRTPSTTQLTGQLIRFDNEQLAPMQNDTVDKVGARTGWTYGPVTQTCVDELVDGVEFICQYRVNAGVGRGDSGSAVFVYHAPDSAIMTGQLFAAVVDPVTGLGQVFIFSPWNNIQAEMGNLKISIAVP